MRVVTTFFTYSAVCGSSCFGRGVPEGHGARQHPRDRLAAGALLHGQHLLGG